MQARASVRTWVSALGSARFDVAVTPVRSARAAWLLLRSGARTRVGFSGGPERLAWTHVAPIRPFEVVFSRRFERLAAALGFATGASGDTLVVPRGERLAAAERLRAAGCDPTAPLIALHVGGGWPTKQWPVEHARELVRVLAQRGRQSLLLGGASDSGRAAQIASGLEASAIVRTGATVAEALAELTHVRAAVGLDSGLSHAGVALGVPTVLLFGPNDPASVLPAPHARLITQELPCRPCNRRGKLRCPEGHHRCMRDTTPAQVLATLRALPGSADL
jgi:ADP-heptose:LPS heptosyltransferase